MLELNKVYNGDSFEMIKDMPDNCVDITITDPPYGMNFQSNRTEIKKKKIFGDDNFSVEFLQEIFRVTRKAVYVFCRWDNLKDLPTPKSVIVWVKNNHTMGDLKHEHGRQWEAICFYPMEEHEFVKRIPDVITANKTGNNLHPIEKPVKLIRELIKANKGNIVFDPFMGSGTTIIACNQLEKDFIGIEIDKDYCKIANNRLSQKTISGTLFKEKMQHRKKDDKYFKKLKELSKDKASK